jgi:hypothetical protein
MRSVMECTDIDLTVTAFIVNVTFKREEIGQLRYVSLSVMPSESDSTELEVDSQLNLLEDLVGRIHVQPRQVIITLDAQWEPEGDIFREFVIDLPCEISPWLRDAIRHVCGPRVRWVEGECSRG